MNAEKIDRELERRIDRLDAYFMRDGSPMTQDEYDNAMKQIRAWEDYQIDHVTR